MIDVLGWVAIIGTVAFLGHHLYLNLLADREVDNDVIQELRRVDDFQAGSQGEVPTASDSPEGSGQEDCEGGKG